MSNIRVRTTPGGSDNYINVNLDQKFDFIEILSLTLRQEDVYRNFCSDYGVVIGRVIVNNGFGVPNAKVSIFIPVDDIDKGDSEIFGLYPYEQVSDKNADGLRYNLLPKKNETSNDCFTPIGSFPNKREVQDNDTALYVYCKYYKFTTTTNESGDYMFFGVPVGSYQVHVDVDMSDIGLLSQAPYDFIREGSNEKLFETTAKFKGGTNLNTLTQLKSRTPMSVNVQPFWGDVDQCQVGITRLDVDLATNITPSAIFMGSIISDSDKNSINKNCRPRTKLGSLDELITGSGRVEMIRKTPDGTTERYDVSGGELIDEDGTWSYQVPMNLDYIITDEFGNITPTDDISKGIPTRARVRFRVKLNMTGDEARLRTTASYLIPNSPSNPSQSDYTFDDRTKDYSFADLYWNKIYSISNHITRVQKNCIGLGCEPNRNFLGIKNVNDGEVTPFPFNKLSVRGNPYSYQLFQLLCIFLSIFSAILFAINKVIGLINNIIGVLNSVLGFFNINQISYIPFILIGCDDNKYCIGCNPNNSGYATTENPKIPDPNNQLWLNCMTSKIAESLDFFKFDFYNDWINGTLYAYLLKYKQKRNGRERFCDYDCEDDENGPDNNNDGDEDNKCRKISVVDTCTLAGPQDNTNVGLGNDGYTSTVMDLSMESGLIKEDVETGELYYAAMSKNGIRLYSTKLINLGAIFDCDWQGSPKFYRYLVDTTYNMPPVTAEVYEATDQPYPGQIETSGYDSPGLSSNSLIVKITCFSIITGSNNCNNVKRLCELGMGLDEDRRDPVTGIGTPVDNKITNADIENPYIRGVFTYLNYPTQLNSIPLVYIDSNSNYNYLDPYYKVFRGYDTLVNSGQPLWFFNNSYYFYFGLNPGKSALQKMYDKYFPECTVAVNNDLNIIIDDVVNDNPASVGSGQIQFHIEGGVGPYTYQWIGPTYNNIQYQCPSLDGSLTESDCGNSDGSLFTLTNLLGGPYTLIVNDSSGLQTSTTVTLTGLEGVQCQITSLPTDSSGNGKILININGGSAIYNVEIQGITDSSFNAQFTATQQTYCYGNCTGPNELPNTVNSLPPGEYMVTVIDSGIQTTINGQQTTIYTQCSDYVVISQPLNIDIFPIVTDAQCYNQFGSGEVTIVGGVAPYDISWVLTSSNNPNHQSLVGTVISNNIQSNSLPSGTYTITVTDLAGNIETSSVVIDEPQETLVTVESIDAPGYSLSDSGRIKLNINGQNGPFNVEVYGQINQLLSNQPNGVVSIDNLVGNETYTVVITDQNDCQIINDYTIPMPIHGEFYVRALTKSYTDSNGVNNSRIIIRFKGGHGGPYHFKLNGNWITIGDPYTMTLVPLDFQQLLMPDYQVYQSITTVNGEPTYEFQFWVVNATGGALGYPFTFDYYLTDGGQQGTYSMFRGRYSLANNGTNGNSQDSSFGTLNPYGFYSYRNDANIAVNGSTPQGILLTQPY